MVRQPALGIRTMSGFVIAATGSTGAFTAIAHPLHAAVLAGAGAGFAALGIVAVVAAIVELDV